MSTYFKYIWHITNIYNTYCNYVGRKLTLPLNVESLVSIFLSPQCARHEENFLIYIYICQKLSHVAEKTQHLRNFQRHKSIIISKRGFINQSD